MAIKKVATIQDRLNEALSVRNMSQSDLGRATGLIRSCINKYSKGIAIPSLERLHQMSLALDVCEVWLLGYDVPMN